MCITYLAQIIFLTLPATLRQYKLMYMPEYVNGSVPKAGFNEQYE
jgi:hypothetical protein